LKLYLIIFKSIFQSFEISSSFQFLSSEAVDWEASLEKTINVVVE